MPVPVLLLGLMGLVAGGGIALQAAVNSQLARGIGSPVTAALISFCVGTAVLFTATLATRQPLPTLETARTLPPYVWFAGGLLGAFYLFSAVFLVPRLGVAVVMSTLIAGQLIMAVALDHFGWPAGIVQEVSLGRIAGVGLMMAGVLMIRFL